MMNAIKWDEVDYVVYGGDISISIEQWDQFGCLINIITMHTSETRNGMEFPFRNKCVIDRYPAKAPF